MPLFSVNLIYSDFKLSPPDVDRAVDLLHKFSGIDEEIHVLREIDWMARMYLNIRTLLRPSSDIISTGAHRKTCVVIFYIFICNVFL